MTLQIGYHCSLERYTPQQHMRNIALAKTCGFKSIMCSDHFYPWSIRQNACINAWPWLGAAMQSVDLPFGVVTAPVQRYHPAIIAQQIATIATLFKGRLWVALGSGQFLNEHIVSSEWLPKNRRNARLKEAIHIINALLNAEE